MITPEKESSIRLVPSAEKAGKYKPLLVYDSDIAQQWEEKPENIWVYRGRNLASLQPEEFPDLKERWQEVILATPEDLFLPELKFIDSENDYAFPGALLPKLKEPLIFHSQRITPLIPLKSFLLNYLSPQDLIKKLKFKAIQTEEKLKIRLTLDLPLSGVKSDRDYENYRLYRDYDLKEENSLGDQLPVLQIWPHFRTENWQEYYLFYFDGELAEQTFQVTCPEAEYVHEFQEGFGTFKMCRSKTFPEYLSCTDFNQEPIGLILCEPAPKIRPNRKWQIGVDFGTKFTNIYLKKSNLIPEVFPLNNLQLQITNAPRETIINTLFENFIPKNFIPQEKPLPLATVLTTRGKNPNHRKLLPILDGRIYVPDNSSFRPQEEFIHTNLDWSPEKQEYSEVFLRHLALHISAIAASEGVEEIQWSVSYPNDFSKSDIWSYAKLWRNITSELQQTTGIIHQHPEINTVSLRSKHLAFAQYFADFEDRDLVYTTCIAMEDDTSDISIWENNALVHQCSMGLAGRDIFSQFLKLNPKFAEQKFGLPHKDWKGLGDGAFNARLDVYFRFWSEDWLREQRPLLQEDEDFQGLIQLMTIGFAGLYYYVGILLRVLHAEGKYKRQQITPVYLGGKASRFINWLDPTGKFDRHAEVNELLSRMLSKASGFKDTAEITNLSQHSQDEVACGLVLNRTRLENTRNKVPDSIIAGEAYRVNGTNFPSNSRIDINNHRQITEFTIPQLLEIPTFLYEYHQAIQDLDLESITSLQGYTPSKNPGANQKLWQYIQRELEKISFPIKGNSQEVSPESTFIYGLKALLKVLGEQWVKK